VSDTPVRDSTVRSVDVRLGVGRRTLRASLHGGPGGYRVVTLAVGHGGADTGDPFLRPAWGDPPLQLPAEALPRLRDALAALDS
jgi:hypothetical protein